MAMLSGTNVHNSVHERYNVQRGHHVYGEDGFHHYSA